MRILILLSVIFALTIGLLFLKYEQVSSAKEEDIVVVKTPNPIPLPIELDAKKLFQLVNGWRIQVGLQPFIQNDYLCKIANLRLPEIKINWSHQGFYSKTPTTCNLIHGCQYGENLADVSNGEESALKMWIDSPKHLENLMYPYQYSCIETDGSYAVQIFANF